VTGTEPIPRTALLISLLRNSGLVCGTAESLTGGLISAEIASVSGASEVLRGSIVAYSNDVKRGVLGVPPELIKMGVVSEPVAIAMARGALSPLGADIILACTGVAGPGSQDGIEPGTVWVACSSKNEYVTEKFTLPGDRNQVRAGTVVAAIDLAISFLTAKL
jgi:nicotinamide-nucleotide amidase